ncbi:hypothetical protein [Actinomadura chokoriensis]|uniref:hypothetical protein n=1 Tax=Actinomadura chokoriensis TaxID=454156 RepID=UPI0031F83826
MRAKRWFAIAAQIISLFLPGVGGTLSAASSDPLASATLVLIGGTPVLFLITLWRYRSSMFSMGSFGTSTTRFCWLLIDTTVVRWIYVVLIAATSVGINIAVPEADGTIGSGVRMAVQSCGTLLVGLLAFRGLRRYIEILLRILILGSLLLATDALSSSEPNIGGSLWAGVCAVHFFTLMKALTVFGTQQNRDSGMALANVIALIAVLAYAIPHGSMPTPEKFAGALLPAGVLYVAIPLTVMIIPVFGTNWARGVLSEAELGMLTSTGPVWGSLAAFGLKAFGWAATPALNSYQVAGIVLVVLLALLGELINSERNKFATTHAEALAKRALRPGQNVDGTEPSAVS